MFGGGTLAVVADPGPLIRSKAGRAELTEVLATVAPGNALVFVESLDRYPKDGRLTSDRAALAGAIEAVGGEVRGYPAPKEGGMARWIEDRARERGMRLERGAAQVLAERVGAFVREGDVDRRRQGQLAVQELDKLALYRLDAPVGVADVEALAAEAVPASTWALLDAIAFRRTRDAADLLDRVLDVTPEPVVLVQLHRRLRELLEVADLIATGTAIRELPRCSSSTRSERSSWRSRPPAGHPTSSRARSTACSISTQWSRVSAGRRSASRHADSGSVCGWRHGSRGQRAQVQRRRRRRAEG